MKKPSSLAQQIAQAQRLLASLPEAKKSSLRLEGSDLYLNKKPDYPVSQLTRTKIKQSSK
ncbi:hypothetical protein [Paraburkholderia sp. UCT31]|uniref:hypothetical protein n=1 Tax=unclassified Paraburkholderia TaxID=2615204 RepID=UPI0016567720|nr:hypothetical protein [Paraburkholderia sp. UCT31]MBC8736873.1 hypothetical protein [Paraburkholderia sp. UCT31]